MDLPRRRRVYLGIPKYTPPRCAVRVAPTLARIRTTDGHLGTQNNVLTLRRHEHANPFYPDLVQNVQRMLNISDAPRRERREQMMLQACSRNCCLRVIFEVLAGRRKFDQNWPTFDQRWPKSGQRWPKSAEIGPIWARYGQTLANVVRIRHPSRNHSKSPPPPVFDPCCRLCPCASQRCSAWFQQLFIICPAFVREHFLTSVQERPCIFPRHSSRGAAICVQHL